MDLVDALALAGITLAAIVLILEAGYFVARIFYARAAAHGRIERRAEDAAAAARAAPMPPLSQLAARERVASSRRLVRRPPRRGRRRRGRRRMVQAVGPEEPPPPFLTEAQRAALRGLANGHPPVASTASGQLLLDWLEALGLVRRVDGGYAITDLGRRTLGPA